MHEKLVSIIMPTYNAGAVIKETIDSVLSQSYRCWELIVVDDCSMDNTVNILNDYSDFDSRIIIHSSDVNKGAGESRNIGIGYAKGKYLAFLDSDDVWCSDKLQKQIDFMLINQAAISHTSYSFIDELSMPKSGFVKASQYVDLERHLKYTEIGTSTSIIDRSKVTENIKFESMRARQDLKLWIRLLSKGYVSKGLDENLVKYRVRKNSVSSNKWKMLTITFYVYYGIKELSFFKRFECYLCYVFNGIKKRVIK